MFVGEIVMAIGIVEVLGVRSPWYQLLRSSPILKALLAFMVLCTLRLAVDLPRYRLDAVRDSSIWYYGVFAVPGRGRRRPRADLRPAPAALVPPRPALVLRWAPIAVALTEVDALAAIYVPGDHADQRVPLHRRRCARRAGPWLPVAWG